MEVRLGFFDGGLVAAFINSPDQSLGLEFDIKVKFMCACSDWSSGVKTLFSITDSINILMFHGFLMRSFSSLL